MDLGRCSGRNITEQKKRFSKKTRRKVRKKFLKMDMDTNLRFTPRLLDKFSQMTVLKMNLTQLQMH